MNNILYIIILVGVATLFFDWLTLPSKVDKTNTLLQEIIKLMKEIKMIININYIPEDIYLTVRYEILKVLMNNNIPYETIRPLYIKDGDTKEVIGTEFNIK